MRVAARRMRSALQAYGKIIERQATRALTDDLKWLDAQLSTARDSEVIEQRLTDVLHGLPEQLLIAPVALPRALFRRHARARLVAAGHAFALAGLAMLGFAVTGVVLVIFGMVLGERSGILAAGCAFVLFATLWAVVPWLWRRKTRSHRPSGRPNIGD
jgi:inorganic triphosphatase YgiF